LSLVLFLAQAAGISLTGVLAPGPITAVCAAKGSRSPHAGGLVTIGHVIAEAAMMAAVFLLADRLRNEVEVRSGVYLAGAAVLLLMGAAMLVSAMRTAGRRGPPAEDGAPAEPTDSRLARAAESPLVLGLVLSAGSPYVIVWWLTVGAGLIMGSLEFGLIGFVLFAIVHWSCDLGWNWLVSAASYRGGRLLGGRAQLAIEGVCGVFLLFMAARFALDGVMRT